MKRERNAFKAGLFIVVSIALGIAVIISIKGAGRVMGPKQVRAVAFKLSDDLGGLRAGDDVRVGGHKVGAVRSIELVEGDEEDAPEPRLLVHFTLPAKYTLRQGAGVTVQTTLTGASVLNIESFGQGKALPADVTLTGAPDPKTVLLTNLGKLGPELSGMMTEVRQETLPGVNDTVAKAGDAMERAGEAMAEVRDLLGPSKGDFKGTMENLNATTGSLREKLPDLLDETGTVLIQVNSALAKIESSLDDFNQTMANSRELTASAKSLLASNRGKLNAMVAGLKIASDNLKAATAEIRRSPWRLLYKPGPNEMANLNIYDSARQFADGASALDDAATALRDALADSESTPEEIQALVEKLEATFSGFKQVEEKLWSTVKE